MSIFPNSTTTLVLLLQLLFLTPRISSINITSLLSPFPDLTDFNALLTSTSVSQDLLHRSSLTLLAVPNFFLRSSPLSHRPPSNIADVLRYHVLLQYLSLPDLLRFPSSGKLVTTLYQTTGRPTGNLGAVNISSGSGSSNSTYVRTPVSYSSVNITILSQIKTLPYNVSIFTVNSLLVPSGLDVVASEIQPPLRLDLARVLLEANNFNIATTLLTASNVTRELEEDEAGAGITMFVPTDDAFFDFPEGDGFKALTANQKTTVLRFHVLHSYYPLGSLESIVNPLQPTVATEEIGAGRFTLNITRVNGSVAIDTGIVQASITRTVFDQNPVAIFAVSKVLLPREIFGKETVGSNKISCDCYAPPPGVFAP